jgi:hypothetical protein
MKKLIPFLYFIILSISFSCIDPFDPKLNTNERKLVVQAWLTNEAPPYTVRLYFSAPYNNKDLNIPVSGARVFMTDDLGKTIPFDESTTTRGFYQSSPTGEHGQIGRTYTLNIRTTNDQLYQSKPELLRPAPSVDTVFSVFKEVIDERGIKSVNFDIIAETKDPATVGNFYKWEAVRYETLENCINRIIGSTDGRPGYRSLTRCCSPCWTITQCQSCIILNDDMLVNGNKIRQRVGSVPYDSRNDAYILVKEYAISKEVHQFWKSVNGQINNSGGIFDEPPATIRGNMFNANKPEEQVLGFFGAAGVSLKPVYVKRNFVPIQPNLPPPDGLNIVLSNNCEPCQERFNRTAKRPPNWQ